MISIITPAYNSERYLEECIKSIKNQSYENYEHIIVDGGSKDKTLDIIKRYEGTYPMRWISEQDNGMYDAISKGFKMAKGDIFCWINSDDILMPWTLETVNRIFVNTTNSWITGIPAQIDEQGVLRLVSNKKITYPHYALRRGWMDSRRVGCVQQESTFWRRSLYVKVGGINTSLKYAGDYDLWYRFAQETPLASYNTILAGFRVHEGQKSSDRSAYIGEMPRLSKLEEILMALKYYKVTNKILKALTPIYKIQSIGKEE